MDGSVVFARWRQCASPTKTCFFGPGRAHKPNGISIGSAVFAKLTSETDRPTDRPRYSVGNNRPPLRTHYWRCGLIITVCTTVADSYMTAASQSAGSVAEQAADRKCRKYGQRSAADDFEPVAVETCVDRLMTLLFLFFQ